MRELTINDLLDLLVDNRRFIIAITILVTLFSVVYTLIIVTPMYESKTKIIIARSSESVENLEENKITANDLMLNQKLVSTYSEIIKSRKVLGKVIEELKLKKVTIREMANNIIVTPVKDSEVINISVKNKSPQNAAKIANKLVSIFSDEVKSIYNIENITVVDVAIADSTPINVNIIKNLIIFMVLGLFGSYGLVFIKEYLDASIKYPEDIEEILGSNILGLIPELDKKEAKEV